MAVFFKPVKLGEKGVLGNQIFLHNYLSVRDHENRENFKIASAESLLPQRAKKEVLWIFFSIFLVTLNIYYEVRQFILHIQYYATFKPHSEINSFLNK